MELSLKGFMLAGQKLIFFAKKNQLTTYSLRIHNKLKTGKLPIAGMYMQGIIVGIRCSYNILQARALLYSLVVIVELEFHPLHV